MKLSTAEKLIFIAVLLFLMWSRLWKLGQVPATLTHDEMVYAIQAKSFVVQGKSLDQKQSYYSIQPIHPMYAEWCAQIMRLGFHFGRNPLFSTHLVSALMGITLPFVLAAFVHGIWKREDVTKAVWILFVFSALFWQMSRLSYDVFYSIWFYMLAGSLFIQPKLKFVLLSIPFYILGFFQYQGFKLLLVPLIIFFLALKISAEIKKWKYSEIIQIIKNKRIHLLVVLLGLIGVALYGFILLPQQSASARLSDLIFNDLSYLTNVVNSERRLTLTNPLLNLLSNKFTAILFFMLEKLLGVFNLHTLFLTIEPNVSGFSVWTHGVFYWMDIVLFFIGVSALCISRKTRTSGLVLIGGILTLCLPTLINTGSDWYLLRSMYSYLLIIVVLGWGLALINSKKYVKYIFIAVYMLSILNFTYNYWYRYPIMSLDWSNFDERILAKYIHHTVTENPQKRIVVYSNEPEFDFWSYLLYEDLLSTNTKDAVAEQMQLYPAYTSTNAEYDFEHISFKSACAPQSNEIKSRVASSDELIIVHTNHDSCPKPSLEANHDEAIADANQKVLSISAILDSGGKIDIYGDSLCAAYATTFVHVQKSQQLSIDTQSIDEFCSLWIKDLDW